MRARATPWASERKRNARMRSWRARSTVSHGIIAAMRDGSPAAVRSRWEAAAGLVAETRDVLDARPAGEDDIPAALASRGWSAFLLSLGDGELGSVESGGVGAEWPERTPDSLRSLVARAHEVCAMPALVPVGARAAGLRPGETPRKRAQIDAFGTLVLSVAARAVRVVDVGSGHGHLTRAIADGTERPVMGVGGPCPSGVARVTGGREGSERFRQQSTLTAKFRATESSRPS